METMLRATATQGFSFFLFAVVDLSHIFIKAESISYDTQLFHSTGAAAAVDASRKFTEIPS